MDSDTTSLEEMFATIDTLYAEHPEIVPVTKEQSAETVTSTPLQAETPFNVAKVIQEYLSELKPTTVFTKCEFKSLSTEEIQSLKPVKNHTIAELLILACGKYTQPCMLNGELYAHTACDQYVKIVPEIGKDGYANYKFTAINWQVLSRLIEKYCELLHATGRYESIIGYHRDAGEKYFDIEPEYDYGTDEDTEEAIDINDVDNIFGSNTSVTAIPKAKFKITDDGDEDLDDCSLSTLNSMLKARMHSSSQYLSLSSLSERLAAQERNYTEDMKLLDYLKVVTKRVYKELKRPWHIPFTKYFDPPYFISSHYLSAWFYFPNGYDSKINNPPLDAQGEVIKYQVDHIKRGIKYRSYNHPENLRIVLKSYNSGRTSRSVEVDYNGDNYVSLVSYCKATSAGNATNIHTIKSSTKQGETFEYNRRIYLKVDDHQLIATDKEAEEVKVPEITCNGVVYPTLTAFAKSRKLSPDAVRVAVSRAKEKGDTEFSCNFKNKRYNFYLGSDGNMTITT